MKKEWLKLRTYDGSQEKAFEEMICQLAKSEKILNTKKFIRVGAPDAGVECYCELTNGDEIGWQAKFFQSMGKAQWAQLDKSFKTAIAKHPNLKKYIICIPLDRPDPRIRNKKGKKVKYAMDIWSEKVIEWTTHAKALKIEIEYWGDSEIFERLSKPENIGRQHYWFNNEEFTENWFKEKLEVSIRNLDKRYTPDLNFELPIAKIFDGLSRDIYFKQQCIDVFDDFLKKTKRVISIKEVELKPQIDEIENQILNFRNLFNNIDFVGIEVIKHTQLSDILGDASLKIDNAIEKLYELNLKKKEEKRKEVKDKKDYYEADYYSSEREYLRKLNNSISTFQELLKGKTVALSNNPCLLLSAEAGKGKSHLLADIAEKRLKQHQYTILLLGQNFNNDEPWLQIKNQLQLSCNNDTFLSSLDAKAESSGSRILFFIDAINEGDGKRLWSNCLAGFITAIRKYPHLGVVFSIRTSYEKAIIKESLLENNELIKVTHYGFQGHEYEASKLFFNAYEIEQPSIPLLHPEFSNPLFLKLFCDGLQKRRLHKIPDGFEGITTIMSFFLESINLRISQKHNLPPELNVISSIVKHLAAKIADNMENSMPFKEAYDFLTGLAETKHVNDKSEFFKDLISEGVLTQNMYWSGDGKYYEIVYIVYERFSDHLRASYLLDTYLDPKSPKDAFKEGQKLFELTKDSNQCYFNEGLIEALSIQIPERVKCELYEVAEHAKDFYPIAAALVGTIIWRKKEFFGAGVLDYINNVVTKAYDLDTYFLNTILQITATPNHPFNSDFLHRYLLRFSMADRDEWWTTYIHHMYPGYKDEATPIRRLIDWAWTDENRMHISDDSIRLMSQTMIWFLTSTNRTLRDSATKALICLLEERINILISLIKTFENVNDPYLVQRLYAVAYGCAVRTSNTKDLKELAEYIFHSVFNRDKVVPDILLRDYARGIIEYSVYIGHCFNFDLKKIRPPYKSELPTVFPSNEEIQRYKPVIKENDIRRKYWGLDHIFSSMAVEGWYGDFGRYVFASAFTRWKDVNIKNLSNLAVKWIIEEYGYDVHKHGEFDERIGSGRGRGNKNMERIGKKYQWIAMHRLLALVADNSTFFADYSMDEEKDNYEGPWEPLIRDIDPTIIIKGKEENKYNTYWWYPIQYKNWETESKKWIYKKTDLPNPIQLINMTDDKGIEWVDLQILTSWNEPQVIGEEKWDHPRKEIWYHIRSYITLEKEYEKIIKWAKEKKFTSRWMPESVDRYEMFAREYYWAPSSKTFKREYYGGSDWIKVVDRKNKELYGKVAVTAIDYLWSVDEDSSLETPIRYCRPTEILFKLLDLKYSKTEGQLLNRKGELICFDPCVSHPTRSCLLVRKADLLKVLKENGLNIFWTVLGEKQSLDSRRENPWLGRLNISGVVNFENGELKYSPKFTKE